MLLSNNIFGDGSSLKCILVPLRMVDISCDTYQSLFIYLFLVVQPLSKSIDKARLRAVTPVQAKRLYVLRRQIRISMFIVFWVFILQNDAAACIYSSDFRVTTDKAGIF